MIPSWAPNAHPMFVHFPIALAAVALGADLLRLVRPPDRADRTAELFYALAALGAAAAYVSGRLAEVEVFIPGMAHPLVESHEQWGLVTTVVLAGFAVVRLALVRVRARRRLAVRAALVLAGLVAGLLVFETAERGARLVYEQGVGVIPGPVPGGPAASGVD